MRKQTPLEAYLANLHFFTRCPECKREVEITDFFSKVRCPYCKILFRPITIVGRPKRQSPSFKEFNIKESLT